YRFARGKVGGVATLISRTGYTGEDGFELYVAAGDAEALWNALLGQGAAEGAAPIGLGARDTLRLEMRYALYGNDLGETTNPRPGQGGARREDAVSSLPSQERLSDVERSRRPEVHARARVGPARGRARARRHHRLCPGTARRRRVRGAAEGRRACHRPAGLWR